MRIIAVSEDVSLVNRIDWTLSDATHHVELAASVAAAESRMNIQPFDVAIVDVRVPDGFLVERMLDRAHVVLLVAHGAAVPELRTFVESHGGLVLDGLQTSTLRASIDDVARMPH